MRVVDVHSHMVPANFPALPVGCGCGAQWPSLERQGAEEGTVLIGGKEFRRIDSRSWDAARRLADMDGEDVLIQVLSPMPELLSYWLEPAATRTLARHINGVLGDMVAAHPRRFLGLGMVPLQDPQLAAAELTFVKRECGLAGIEIGSNILGRSPGDPFFDPVYAEAERLNLCIFVHALHPTTNDRLVGPKPLAAFVGFPTDVGLAASSFVTGATLQRFPKLRIAFSHGGGTFAAILPRLQHGWSIAPELTSAFPSPLETARRFFYDNIVMDPEFLHHLVRTFGATQVLAGSDYPYIAGQRFPGRPFDVLKMSDATLGDLLVGNALRFLDVQPN